MASTRAAAARRTTTRRTTTRPSPRPRAARRPAARPLAGVRWERLGRVALVVVVGGILLLYVGPLISYVQTWQESKTKRADLHALERENARLVARRRELREPASLERAARGMGMVRQGERAFVIENLPGGG